MERRSALQHGFKRHSISLTSLASRNFCVCQGPPMCLLLCRSSHVSFPKSISCCVLSHASGHVSSDICPLTCVLLRLVVDYTRRPFIYLFPAHHHSFLVLSL